jgi:hypothetical protein
MEDRPTDAEGRVSLPEAFADATVILEQVGETEVRICQAVVIPQDEVRPYEETADPLPDRDRDPLLDLLDKPPSASTARKPAARRHAERHG